MTLVVRDGSWVSFNWLPWLFEAQYFLLARFPPTRWLALRLGSMLGARRLRRTIRDRDPDLIVSTYPGTTAVLGELRVRGRLQAPVVSAITDLAGLRFWAHPGVDLHTVTYRESIEEVEAIAGPGSARWAQPPTSDEFLRPVSRAEARARLELPARGKVVVVSGGGWGIGDLTGAVEAALDVEGSTVVCLSGHSERARRRLEQQIRVESARSTPRVHRPDERPARRGGRARPLHGGADRPRGPDPRVSGDLVRVRGRPHPCQQPRVCPLRARECGDFAAGAAGRARASPGVQRQRRTPPSPRSPPPRGSPSRPSRASGRVSRQAAGPRALRRPPP